MVFSRSISFQFQYASHFRQIKLPRNSIWMYRRRLNDSHHIPSHARDQLQSHQIIKSSNHHSSIQFQISIELRYDANVTFCCEWTTTWVSFKRETKTFFSSRQQNQQTDNCGNCARTIRDASFDFFVVRFFGFRLFALNMSVNNRSNVAIEFFFLRNLKKLRKRKFVLWRHPDTSQRQWQIFVQTNWRQWRVLEE